VFVKFFLLTPPMMMEQTECSETLAHKIQMLGNHPKERIRQFVRCCLRQTPPMMMEQTECSETLAHKIQMLGNHPKERIQQFVRCCLRQTR